MDDKVAKVTSRNYFQRLGGSFQGILIGLLLILGAFVVLWRNEGNFVRVSKSLDEGRGAVVNVEKAAVLPENEGELIHTTAQVNANGTLSDETFGVSGEYLQLNRKVEMYQWQQESSSETREKVGGGQETTTTYTYTTDWSENAVDSSSFEQPAGHENPGALPYENNTITSQSATLGDFRLEDNIINRIGGEAAVGLGEIDVSGIDNAQVNGNFIFIGDSPGSPEVGDVRVSFTATQPQIISVAAKQVGNRLTAYKAESGSTVLLVSTGERSADELFTSAEEANKLMTWIFRGLGFILMWAGLNAVFGPLSMIFAVIPFFKRLVGGVVSFATFIIAFVLSGLTIALAWLFYRPVLSIILLAITAVVTYLLKTQVFDKKPQLAEQS